MTDDRELSELRAKLDLLQGVVLASDMPLLDQPQWAIGLTPQQRILMGILIKASPHAVDRWEIFDRLPSLDHVQDRAAHLVAQQVYEVRKLLGRDCIETVAGGYRLSGDFCERMAKAA